MMRLLLALWLLLFSGVAAAEDPRVEAHHRLALIEDLAARQVLSVDEQRAETDRLLEQTSALVGHRVESQDLVQATINQENTGFSIFIGLAWLAGGCLLLVALVWLTKLYVIPWIRSWPGWLKELLLHLAVVTLMLAPRALFEGGLAATLGFVGCLLLVVSLAYTNHRHTRGRLSDRGIVRTYGGTTTAAWGAMAVLYGSELIGVIAVIAAGVVLGLEWVLFWEHRAPGKRDHAPLAMTIGAVFMVTSLCGPGAEVLWMFEPGALYVGSTALFGGALALASRHYKRRSISLVASQVLVVMLGFIGIYVGSVWGLDDLREIAGSALVLYAFEKLLEIDWKRHGYAWMCLALAGLLFGVAQLAETDPGLFIGFDSSPGSFTLR